VTVTPAPFSADRSLVLVPGLAGTVIGVAGEQGFFNVLLFDIGGNQYIPGPAVSDSPCKLVLTEQGTTRSASLPKPSARGLRLASNPSAKRWSQGSAGSRWSFLLRRLGRFPSRFC